MESLGSLGSLRAQQDDVLESHESHAGSAEAGLQRDKDDVDSHTLSGLSHGVESLRAQDDVDSRSALQRDKDVVLECSHRIRNKSRLAALVTSVYQDRQMVFMFCLHTLGMCVYVCICVYMCIYVY
jgi:hypothetical protein